MSYSYHLALDRPLDKVRLLTGDTKGEDTHDLEDEEILFFLQRSDDPYACAVFACRALAARFAGLIDKQVGDLKLSYSQKAKQYLDLAAALEEDASALVGMYAGGQTVTDKSLDDLNPDLVRPAIRRGITDYPQSTDPRYSGPTPYYP